jgi:hypothetical protein
VHERVLSTRYFGHKRKESEKFEKLNGDLCRYCLIFREELQNKKTEARKEFLEVMEQTKEYWIRSPVETTYTRYMFDHNFRLRGTKFEKWYESGQDPMMKISNRARSRAA